MYEFVLSIFLLCLVPSIAQNIPSQVHIALAGKNHYRLADIKVTNWTIKRIF